jgi:hypothetical protein
MSSSADSEQVTMTRKRPANAGLSDDVAEFDESGGVVEVPVEDRDDADEVSYEVTQRHEPFKGTEVSRKSVAALVTDIVTQPDRWVRANLGVNKPGTDGDKPAFF